MEKKKKQLTSLLLPLGLLVVLAYGGSEEYKMRASEHVEYVIARMAPETYCAISTELGECSDDEVVAIYEAERTYYDSLAKR